MRSGLLPRHMGEFLSRSFDRGLTPLQRRYFNAGWLETRCSSARADEAPIRIMRLEVNLLEGVTSDPLGPRSCWGQAAESWETRPSL